MGKNGQNVRMYQLGSQKIQIRMLLLLLSHSSFNYFKAMKVAMHSIISRFNEQKTVGYAFAIWLPENNSSLESVNVYLL